MGFSRLIAMLIFGMWATSANGATIKQAYTVDGDYRWAIKVEGNIVPGDAAKLLTKLLDFYLVAGPVVDTVYLMSRGGDINDAMKMGDIIRRLRLKTVIPMKDMGSPASTGGILPDNPNDAICASACFLVFVGGVEREGDYLALHRPYLPRVEANKLSDIEYEAAQKQVMVKVQGYLRSMDVGQFWIDTMMSTNSQDVYVPAWSELDRRDRPLIGTVPPIEEIMLAKCGPLPDIKPAIGSLKNDDRPTTTEEKALMASMVSRLDAFNRCENKALYDMRKAAFDREVEADLMPQCTDLTSQEAHILRLIQDKVDSKSPLTAEENERRTMLLNKYFAFRECKLDALGTLLSKAHERESAEFKRMLSIDMSRESHSENGSTRQ